MAKIETYTEKTSLVDTDLFVIADSEAANATKKATRAAVLTDATELPFTIGSTVMAKINSTGLLTDSITELTASHGVTISGNGINHSSVAYPSGLIKVDVGNVLSSLGDWDEDVNGTHIDVLDSVFTINIACASTLKLNIGVGTFVDNAAALSGGLVAGNCYWNSVTNVLTKVV